MIRKALVLPIILLCHAASLAQQASPFDNLVAQLEKRHSLTFHYDRSQTRDISVGTIAGEWEDVLKELLESTGLQYTVDRFRRVFIYRGTAVQPSLPSSFFGKGTAMAKDDSSTVLPPALVTAPEDENRVYIIGERGSQGTAAAVLSGYVRDGASGEPLGSVSVVLEGRTTGVSTDAFGFYSITVPKGKQSVRFSSIGMREMLRKVHVLGNGRMDIEMREEVRSLKAAVVVARRQSNVRGMQMGVERLNIRTIRYIPAVMGETDILRSLLTLPGVTTVGEGTVGFNVRGGAADQNLVLLNDMTIFNPTHLFGFFSAVDPEVVRGLELYKSAIPERLGGRLSSILDVSTRDGNAKKVAGTAGIGPLTSKFTLEGPIGSSKTTFISGGRMTYSNWLLRQLPEATFGKSKVGFGDILLHLSHELSEKDRVYLSGYLSEDRFRLNDDSTYDYRNRNLRVKWRHDFTEKLNHVLSAGVDRYGYGVKGRNNPRDAFDLGFDMTQWSARYDVRYAPDNRQDLSFGLQHILYRLQPGSIEPADPASAVKTINIPSEQATETSAYLGDQLRVSDKLSVQAGIRYTLYRFLGPGTSYSYAPDKPRSAGSVADSTVFGRNALIQPWHGPEFRLSARYLLGTRGSLKFSYNTLRQYVHMITNTMAISPTDTWKLSDRHIRPQFGQQASFGIYAQPGDKGVEVSAEAYYKTSNNYLDYRSGATLLLNEHLERDVIATKGRAYGVELQVKKPNGKLNGWVSYTWLRTFLKADDPLGGEVVNNGREYPANFDKPHIASLVANYRFTQRFSISLTSTYSTGRPMTVPIGIFDMGGSSRVFYSDRNAFRIPDFFRTDLSMNVENNHKVRQRLHGAWSFGVYNLTGRDNPYSVYFVAENRTISGYQLSVFASAMPFVTFNLKF